MLSIMYSMGLTLCLLICLINVIFDKQFTVKGNGLAVTFWSIITIGNYLIVFQGINKFF